MQTAAMQPRIRHNARLATRLRGACGTSAAGEGHGGTAAQRSILVAAMIVRAVRMRAGLRRGRAAADAGAAAARPALAPPATPPGRARPAATRRRDAGRSKGFFPFSLPFGKQPSPAQATRVRRQAARDLLDRVSLYLSSVQTMVGNFVQIGPDGGRTEGTFYIQKPGKVRFEYNPPSPIDIIADGSSVVVRDRDLATQDCSRCRRRRCAISSPTTSICCATPTSSACRPTTISSPWSSRRSR